MVVDGIVGANYLLTQIGKPVSFWFAKGGESDGMGVGRCRLCGRRCHDAAYSGLAAGKE